MDVLAGVIVSTIVLIVFNLKWGIGSLNIGYGVGLAAGFITKFFVGSIIQKASKK